jgi:hypothetical protein
LSDSIDKHDAQLEPISGDISEESRRMINTAIDWKRIHVVFPDNIEMSATVGTNRRTRVAQRATDMDVC